MLTDQGHKASLEEWVQQHCRFLLEVVTCPAGQHGFLVVPQRWKVERSIAWLGRNLRLSKDYEQHTEHSESMIYLASIGQLVRRATNTAFA